MAGIEINVLGAVIDTSQIGPALDSAAGEVRRFARGARDTFRNVTGGVESLIGSIFNLRNSIIGLAGGAALGSAIAANKRFEESISDLSAITGATGKDLEFLAEKSKEFGSVTTLSSSQAAEAFKLVASAKPDLLDNVEALSAVTKEAITLAEASGTTLPEAARSLGSALNQFGADASEAGRFINVLAAGSQKGASEIAETAEALKQSGVVASAASVSFEELNGAIQTLATVGIKGGEAGTALRNVILKLRNQGVEELDPAIQGLAGSLRNLGAANLDTSELTKLFGLENIAAAEALISNVDKVEDLTKSITDTEIAYAQASIKVDNLTGDLKTFGSAVELAQIELGEALNPSVRDAIQFFTALTRAIIGGTKPALDDLQESGSQLGLTLFKAGEVGGKGIGILADGVRGLEIAAKGIEIAFEGAKGAVIVFVKGAADSLQVLAESMNSILSDVEDFAAALGQDLDLSEFKSNFTAATETFDELLDKNAVTLRGLRNELQELLLQDLPSKTIEDTIRRISETTSAELEKIRQDLERSRANRSTGGSDAAAEEELLDAALLKTTRSTNEAELATERLKLGRIRLSQAEKAYIALQREGRLLTESLRTEEEIRNDEIERAKFLLDQKVITEQTYARAITEANDALLEANRLEIDRAASTERTTAATRELERSYRSTENAIISMARNGELSFDNFARAVIADIVDIIFESNKLTNRGGIIQSLIGGIGGFFGGGGSSTVGSSAALAAATGPEVFFSSASQSSGIFDSLLSGFTSFFGFANGGRPPTGKPIVVGERGPELFVPDVNGRVVSNANIGGTTQVFLSTNITVESLDPSNAAEVVERALPEITSTFDAMVQEAFSKRLQEGPMG